MNILSVLWIAKYNQDFENKPHQHSYFQILSPQKGHGTIVIANKKYDLVKENIYLCPPETQHALIPDKDSKETIKMIDIKFSINDPKIYDDIISLGNCFTTENYNWFCTKFDRMLRESENQNKYYYNLINAMFFNLMVELIREKQQCTASSSSSDTYEIPEIYNVKGFNLSPILSFISKNYSRSITLNELCKMSGVNKTVMISAFKELFATTPIQYINQIRLNKAKGLLSVTDLNIGEISDLVGFQSIHYFSRYFKLKENVTPIEYRVKNSQNKYFCF